MTQLILSTPVLWPPTRERTPASQRTTPQGIKGDMNYAEVIRDLRDELANKPYEKATLYTCYEDIENDRMRKKVDAMNGVSLLLTLDNDEYLLPCDTWTLTQLNIYAIHTALHNLHQAEKWRVGDMRMLLRAFARKESVRPVLGGAAETWREALGLGQTAMLADANATYRARAKEMATDEASLMKLNKAIEEARRVLR